MPEQSQTPASVTATWAARLLRVRWIVRMPVWLYRARLGFVFGSRLLMLEHTGDRAQRLRNVRADPRVRVRVGARRPAPATARLLNSQDAAAALTAYAHGHQHYWRSPELALRGGDGRLRFLDSATSHQRRLAGITSPA